MFEIKKQSKTTPKNLQNTIFRCDGGTQTRMVVCLNYDKKPVPGWCEESVKPAEEQECNVDSCPSKN